MTVEERPSKQPRYEEESLTYKEEDAKYVIYHHNDVLIIIIQIAHMKVKICLVDTGTSVYIMYKSSFDQMKLSINDLKRCSQVIYRFIGEGLSPSGTIKLVVTTGDAPKHETVMTEFLIIDSSLAYNVVIGRILLMALDEYVLECCLIMSFVSIFGAISCLFAHICRLSY